MLRHRERMKENGIAPLTWEGKRSAAAVPDPEVVDKPIRRRFAPSYKLRIVEEADRSGTLAPAAEEAPDQSNKSVWVPVRTRMRASSPWSQTNSQSGSM